MSVETKKKHRVYLGLGSNLGDRLDYLEQAKKQLSSHSGVVVLKSSPIYETEPWPKSDHKNDVRPWHLNQVILIETSLSPRALLTFIKQIEHDFGRRKKEHWGDREIDIDILLYENQMVDLPDLKVPHPYMHERAFVLKPLLDLDAELKDPRTGEDFQVCLEQLSDSDGVILYS